MSHGSDEITDLELDSTLRSALSVDLPSNFVERTRMRIGEVAPRSIIGLWLVPSTVLASVVVTAVVLMPSQRKSTLEPVIDIPLASGSDIVLHPALDTQHTQTSTPDARAHAATPPRVRAAAQPALASEFEVLISPSDAAAYRRLYASVASTRYELVIDEMNRAAAEKTVTDIEITPIAIPPLDPAEEQGVLQ